MIHKGGGRMQTKILLIVILCISFFIDFFVFTTTLGAEAEAETDFVRAKIGIQIKSNNKIIMAKSNARLKTGDLFRIYVHSEENSVIYIIYADEKTVSLLNMTEQKIQSSTLILPSAQAYYEIDGNSSVENITIICSPHKLSELAAMETGKISYKKWLSIRDNLIGKSKILLSHKNEEPFSIGGTVRGVTDSATDDSFAKKLQIYSGKGLLVKKYEFKVKK